MSTIAVIAHSHHPIRDPYAGGMEKHTHMLCRELASRGHEVVLYAKGGSVADGYEVREVVPEDNVFRSHLRGSLPWKEQDDFMNQRYSRVLRDIEVGNADAVVNNSLNSVPLEWAPPVPVLNLLHTPVLWWLHKAARVASANPRMMFASVSGSNAAPWRDYVTDVRVVRNGVDIRRPSKSLRTECLHWVGRITPEKGLHEAIDTARIAGRRLRFAGPISDAAYFEDEIKPQLDSSIEYVGHLSRIELARFYASGAVTLATPLWEEPFGLVVAESLTCGTPVAVYPRGAMAELVRNDVGVVAERATPESLASAIASTAGLSSERCAAVGATSFSVPAMVDRYLELIEEVHVRSQHGGPGGLCAV